ncbi:hypothetical protein ATM97_05395 [Nocardia sp. MH4]|uniref:MobF family relaxase n=1 Tax=Nocardia sp. MH4 TaxID=1768677 RepID=UPI001C4E2F42|nr:MobF family relaxase [Nocardia sp. MH4]MBW0275198.1 hypothetical protein [Nocardia sp. MH4]
MFTADVVRVPLNSRELSGWIARASRPSKTAVAGFDLTFSPVKSVSTLWVVAPREVSEQIEAAHHAAIRDVVSFIEPEVLYPRVGRHSVRQVEVAGIIATAFDHRDSCAGDPDLHTHLVIANTVLRADGKWGAIDGRMIYRYNVTCSEMYNTRLESHLEATLGLVLADRGEVVDKRPVREVVGVDAAELAREWSKHGRDIRSATAKLAEKFQADHGRGPTALELVDLSQQATLCTRASKHAARSRAEQRATWRADAIAVLGSEAAVEAMVDSYLDALGVAAETRYGAVALAALDDAAEALLPGLTTAAAYPVLRQHLVTLALDGTDPVDTLTTAIGARELGSAADAAAVLDWRIDPTGYHSGRPGKPLGDMGPLGWPPIIPAQLRADREFGPHLAARDTQIRDLAHQVADLARTWSDAPPTRCRCGRNR